ncbi:hypothetical protein M6B38_347885 [Iris pallida]|uniref:Uncharacterized protein n=1 Tax=Iris pallida TaxID=29817 RepID=A0AAX6GSZ8_IRIPA|nr:hypothetical protein M6B38_347885 [Iris pallida]
MKTLARAHPQSCSSLFHSPLFSHNRATNPNISPRLP